MVHRPYCHEGRKWRYRDVYGRRRCSKLIYTLEDTGEEDVAGKIICLGYPSSSISRSLGVKRDSLEQSKENVATEMYHLNQGSSGTIENGNVDHQHAALSVATAHRSSPEKLKLKDKGVENFDEAPVGVYQGLTSLASHLVVSRYENHNEISTFPSKTSARWVL